MLLMIGLALFYSQAVLFIQIMRIRLYGTYGGTCEEARFTTKLNYIYEGTE